MQNVESTALRGKVHKLVRSDTYTHEVIGEDVGHPDYGIHAPWCDRSHSVDDVDYDLNSGWFLPWRKTNQPITCKTCLKVYWPDGRERPKVEPVKEDGVKVTAKKVGREVHIKTAIFDNGKSLGSSAVAISRSSADKLWDQLNKILNKR